MATTRLTKKQKPRSVEQGLTLLSPKIVPLSPAEEAEVLDSLACILIASRSGSLARNELAVPLVAERLSED